MTPAALMLLLARLKRREGRARGKGYCLIRSRRADMQLMTSPGPMFHVKRVSG